ncbi:hypothetical protein Tco_1206785 [Tanacetum coccineum]
MKIGTRLKEVNATAITMGCSIFTTPFVHLGVKVGGAMFRIKSWDGVVAKVSSCLSKWKLKTLSIVLKLLESIRRNFFNGVDGSEIKMAWISWNKEDPWLDDLALKHKFPRLYALDNYKQITVVEKINLASMVDTFRRPTRGGAEEEQLSFLLSRMDRLILTNILDRWVRSLEARGEFSVKSVRQLIVDSILPKEEVAIRWVNVMAIKINVFAWRVCLDKLPIRLNPVPISSF